MRHSEAEEMLARRPELTLRAEARLQQHLDGCPACRELADAYERQGMLLRALPLVLPPPALRGAVLAEVRQPRRHWPSFAWPSFRPVFAIGPLGVCAATVLAALIYRHQLAPSSTAPAALNAPIHSTARPSAGPRHRGKTRAKQALQRQGKRHSSGTGSGSTKSGAAVALGSVHGTAPAPTASTNGAATLPSVTPVLDGSQPLLSAAPPATSAPTTAAGPSQTPGTGGTRAGGSGQKPPASHPTAPQPAGSPVVPTVIIVYRSTATPVPQPTVGPPVIAAPKQSPTPTP